MDLIYTDKNRIEQGVLQKFAVDFDTTDKMDFQITTSIKNNVLKGGSYWYIVGTEYGGRVDSYKVITETNEIQYTGRNFRGMLNSKVIEPPVGEDYRIMSGWLHDVVSELISNADLQDLFVVDDTDIIVVKYKFNRYIKLYTGIRAIAFGYGLIPSFTVKNDGKVHISFAEAVDYSDDNEYTQDDLNFTIQKTYADVNHLICLGGGELSERLVCHLYADAEGNISEKQTFFGVDEIIEIYENTNASDLEALQADGVDRFNELKNTDRFEVTATDLELKIGDIIGGVERITDSYVAREIVNIIAKFSDTQNDLEYKVGEDDAHSSVVSGGSVDLSSYTLATDADDNLYIFSFTNNVPSFEYESSTGNLYVLDSSTTFEYDSETGNLYIVEEMG